MYSGPTSLSIWAILQQNKYVLFAVHPRINMFLVELCTKQDAVTESFMHESDAKQEAFKAMKEVAYSAYLVGIGQKVG
jgi:hypothetical protein